MILCKMDDGTAEVALEGFTRQKKKMLAFMRKSLAYDRVNEMACFRQLSERLNINIWFCGPYALVIPHIFDHMDIPRTMSSSRRIPFQITSFPGGLSFFLAR